MNSFFSFFSNDHRKASDLFQVWEDAGKINAEEMWVELSELVTRSMVSAGFALRSMQSRHAQSA